jgi:hypothetical protein
MMQKQLPDEDGRASCPERYSRAEALPGHPEDVIRHRCILYIGKSYQRHERSIPVDPGFTRCAAELHSFGNEYLADPASAIFGCALIAPELFI